MSRSVHPHDRVPFVLVGVAGAGTVLLLGTLAFAIFPSRPALALGATLAVCAPFAGIIAWGIHRTRVREVLEPLPFTGAASADFVLDLTEEMAALRATRERDVRRGRLLAGGVAVALGVGVGAATVWWIGAALAALLGALLPWLTAQDRALGALLRARRDGAGRACALRVDDVGLCVPVELTSGVTQRQALDAGEVDVRIAWERIARWEVHAAYDDIPALHVLTLDAPAGTLLPLDRVGILRTGTVLAAEDAFLAALRGRLRCGIEVQGAPG